MGSEGEKWGFHGNEDVNAASGMTVQGVLIKLMENLKVANKGKPTIHLGLGDPTAFPCFRSYTSSENAIVDALRSSEFNCYPPACGVPSARRAIAEYMSRDLSCQLSPDDVFVTAGCTHAIEIVISVIARPGANILLPRPNILFLVGGLVGLLQMTPTASLKNLGSRTGLYNPQPGSRHVHPEVELNVSLLEDISDDVDFCLKLAKEESVIVLPGSFVGLKNWIRITFAVEPAYLEDGLKRIKAFYHRHAACHDAISTKNP